MDRIERRAVEFRATDAGQLEGVLVPYNIPSRIGGVFNEEFAAGGIRIMPGLLANRQHDRARPLARLGHGLTITDNGVEVRAALTLPDTTEARDVRALVEAGVLRGFSAEFRTISEDWPAVDRRVIREAELMGLAVVDNPAHESALIAEVRAKMTVQTYEGPTIWL